MLIGKPAAPATMSPETVAADRRSKQPTKYIGNPK
jgi:hypothetical protein